MNISSLLTLGTNSEKVQRSSLYQETLKTLVLQRGKSKIEIVQSSTHLAAEMPVFRKVSIVSCLICLHHHSNDSCFREHPESTVHRGSRKSGNVSKQCLVDFLSTRVGLLMKEILQNPETYVRWANSPLPQKLFKMLDITCDSVSPPLSPTN
jgi:hypothetical protein